MTAPLSKPAIMACCVAIQLSRIPLKGHASMRASIPRGWFPPAILADECSGLEELAARPTGVNAYENRSDRHSGSRSESWRIAQKLAHEKVIITRLHRSQSAGIPAGHEPLLPGRPRTEYGIQVG